MSGSLFFDTNVVVYAYDKITPAKQAAARRMLTEAMAQGNGVISTQVLGEFFHAVVIKRKMMTAAEALEIVTVLESGLRVEPVTPELVRGAIAIHRRFQLRYWDSLIIATALHGGCDEVVSEDMNDGQHYGALVVKNPFKIGAPDI